jgi:hypothetical protein
VLHAYNPSYPGGSGRRTPVQAWPKQKHDTLPREKNKKGLKMWLKWQSAFKALSSIPSTTRKRKTSSSGLGRCVYFLWLPHNHLSEPGASFSRITTTVTCNMDLSKYPMDTQTCKLQLESCEYGPAARGDFLVTWMGIFADRSEPTPFFPSG